MMKNIENKTKNKNTKVSINTKFNKTVTAIQITEGTELIKQIKSEIVDQ